jgi:Tfp pilus assembly protein FimT
MLVVTAIIAVMLGVSYPSIAGSLDSIRLAATADSVAALLHAALDRAERRQEVIELRITRTLLEAASADGQFTRTVAIPTPLRIEKVEPADPAAEEQGERRVYFYPGGSTPRVTVTLGVRNASRRIALDPITGAPEVTQGEVTQ